MRPRLLLFIAIPTVAAVALGGASVVGSWHSAVADQRSETLASLSAKVNELAYQVEGERDAIVWYVAEGENGRTGQIGGHATQAEKRASAGQLQIVQQQERYADPWVKTVTTSLAGFGSGYPRAVQAVANAVTAKLRTLPNLRHLALDTNVPATDVLLDYGSLVSTLLAFDTQVVLSGDDPQFISAAQSTATMARYTYEESVQRAIVMFGLTSDSVSPGLLSLLNASTENQKADFSDFDNFATSTQTVMFDNALAQSLEDRFQTDEQAFVANVNRPANAGIAANDWYGAASDVILATQKFDRAMATSAVDRARTLHDRAILSASIVGGIILLVLLFSLGLAVFVGRSMPEPRRPVKLGETMA